MGKLSGKTALVTGGSRGIGRAIAVRLAQEGAFVIINYAGNESAATEVARRIDCEGGQATTIQARIGSSSETETLFRAVDEILARRQGGGRIDVLVNNAGLPYFGMLSKCADWTKLCCAPSRQSGMRGTARERLRMRADQRGREFSDGSPGPFPAHRCQPWLRSGSAMHLVHSLAIPIILDTKSETENAIPADTPVHGRTRDVNTHFTWRRRFGLTLQR
jgi:hypothetical protein